MIYQCNCKQFHKIKLSIHQSYFSAEHFVQAAVNDAKYSYHSMQNELMTKLTFKSHRASFLLVQLIWNSADIKDLWYTQRSQIRTVYHAKRGSLECSFCNQSESKQISIPCDCCCCHIVCLWTWKRTHLVPYSLSVRVSWSVSVNWHQLLKQYSGEQSWPIHMVLA